MIFDRSTSRGRPDRGSSINPSIPFASYRARQDVTVGRDTPTRSAIAVLLTPSAANKMILARCAKPARIDDDRVHSVNRYRSPDRNERATTRIHNAPNTTVKLLTTRRTRGRFPTGEGTSALGRAVNDGLRRGVRRSPGESDPSHPSAPTTKDSRIIASAL